MRIDQLFDELALAIGILLLLVSAWAFARTRRFIANCRTTTGRISGYTAEEDSDSGTLFYFPKIRFRDASGVEHEIPGPHGLQEPPVVGTEVPITYDPSYPTNAWITGSFGPSCIPWLILILGIAAVVASFVIRAES